MTRDLQFTNDVLADPAGNTMPIPEKARKQLEQLARTPDPAPEAGDRFPAPLDGGADPDVPSGAGRQVQLWYNDPADHPHAYIVVSFEDGHVLVRDGNDPTGKALQWTTEQWAAYSDVDEKPGKADDGGAPAEVIDPDQLSKVKPRTQRK